MKEDIANLWTQALESGKYDQCRGALKRVEESGYGCGYCCLGVLCELYREENEDAVWVHDDYGDGERFFVEDEAESAVLPHVVREWSGLALPDGWITSEGRSLASLNDEGASFLQIAELIRKHREEL
jgi:hypothetical protein